MKRRDYLVIETNSNDPEHIARLTDDILDAYANLEHDPELDLEERRERARTTVNARAVVFGAESAIETREERDPISNALRVYLVIAPKGKVNQSLAEHKKRWNR